LLSKAEKFWDRMAERYSKRPISDMASYEEKLRITGEYMRPEMRVLEFGCGTGSTALIHAPSVRQIHAIDVSKNMIKIARSKAGAMDIKNVTFACSAIEDLEMREGSFDMVLGLSILHLLDNWREVLLQVNRLLKPGGVFVSSTACIGDSMNFLKWILPIGAFLRLIPTVKVFKQQDLEKGLVDAGFEIDKVWQPGKNKAVFIVAKKPG
jgi:ubiquinone/menaquinone biosynthesis C-methylase UbiE